MTTPSKRALAPLSVTTVHACFASQDAGHRVARADGTLRHPFQDALHVGLRAPLDGAPGMTLPEADEAVVVQEAQQVVDGEVHDLRCRGRPDRRDDRHQEVIAEGDAVAALVEEGAQGLARPTVFVEATACHAVEAPDVRDHAPVGDVQEARRLREHATRPERAELEAAGTAGVPQRHLRGLGLHAQLSEQPGEARIGGLVVDDEAGVDGERPSRCGHGHGLDVAARLRLSLVERARGGRCEGRRLPTDR